MIVKSTHLHRENPCMSAIKIDNKDLHMLHLNCYIAQSLSDIFFINVASPMYDMYDTGLLSKIMILY